MPGRLKKTPELYTIPAHSSFVEGLVRGIRARFGDDPLTLSDVLILLPNRRAVRSLRDAFLREGNGKALLLPRMEPIGDVDEDDLFLSGNLPGEAGDMTPSIPPHIRQMLLMNIIDRWYRRRGDSPPEMAQCAILARTLGQFLDHVQTEQLTFSDLDNLVPSEYASHWQQTLDFLKILTEHWPDILSQTGFTDVAARRNILLGGLREKWLKNPPPRPVIAAGSTGSIPATARLLEVVARLPQGMIVLPGLDLSMDGESWDLLDDTHPQATMKHLLDVIRIRREDVGIWPEPEHKLSAGRRARHYLLQEMMRPAQTTDHWRSLNLDLARAMEGLTRLEAPGPREEAGMIALMLRKVVETEGRTAALVTPDRQLARRVAAEMKRWDIFIDDSAGIPLSNTPVGIYLRLTAQMIGEGMAPVPLLSVLKHPLSAGGEDVGAFRKMVRFLEEKILRGPRPGPGCSGIALAIETASETKRDMKAVKAWWSDLSGLIMPFEQVMAGTEISFEQMLASHIEMTEKLCATDDQAGAARLWRGEAGEEAARLIGDLQQAASCLPGPGTEDYPALLQVFMADITVRPKYGQHPRLHIWGPMEARLQQADLVILAGLNEGSWPAEVAPDPWMSRPMRKSFGLPSQERKIGLGAHDFIQAASAPQVVLSRSKKIAGTPTVPSRWLSRMDAIAPEIMARGDDTARWLHWYHALDKPAKPEENIDPPRPIPPLSARPRQLSVTRIQKWIQDPYSIYARYILNLTVMDPLDTDPGAADKGMIIHEALNDFMVKFQDQLPGDALAELIDIGREKFAEYIDRPTVQAFWWPRFTQMAEWFVTAENIRRLTSKTVATEVGGKQVFDLPGGQFTLTAKADRIDLLGDGSYSIIDYKTGKSPSRRQIEAGYAPQLPLEGLMMSAGNFAGLEGGPVSELSYWQLKGGEEVAKITAFNSISHTPMDVAAVIQASREGLLRLVMTFDQPDTPYLNHPRPDNLGWGDYDHLARTKEWQGKDLTDVSPLPRQEEAE